jgi:hypothetical protein
MSTGGDRAQRARLRAALRARYPWLDHTDLGPRSVTAGECGRCGTEARLVATCGPGPHELGRRCVAVLGTDAWCEGHRDQALAAIDWLARLPAEADDVARLWWVATGEVRLDVALRARIAALGLGGS